MKITILSLVFVFAVVISGCSSSSKETNIQKTTKSTATQPKTEIQVAKSKPVVTPKIENKVITQDKKAPEVKPEPLVTPETKKEVAPKDEKVSEVNSNPVIPASVIDCGTNFQCLVVAAKDCKLAKVKRIDTSDLSQFSKVIAYDHKLLEIRGYEDKKCLARFFHEKTTAKYSNPAGGDPNTAENINYAQKEANTLYGYSKSAGVLEIKCKFTNNTQLVSLLEKWNKTTEGLTKTDIVDLGCIDY